MPHFFKRCWSWISNDVLIAWLISQFLKLKGKEPTSVVKTETEELIEKWKTIDLSRIDRVFSSDMSMVEVELRVDKIISYRAYLKMVVDCYARDIKCSRQSVLLPRQKQKLKSFFLDNKDCFLEPLKESIFLKEEVLAFLEYYNVSEKNGDASYSHRYNNILTVSLIAELADLYKVLSL